LPVCFSLDGRPRTWQWESLRKTRSSCEPPGRCGSTSQIRNSSPLPGIHSWGVNNTSTRMARCGPRPWNTSRPSEGLFNSLHGRNLSAVRGSLPWDVVLNRGEIESLSNLSGLRVPGGLMAAIAVPRVECPSPKLIAACPPIVERPRQDNLHRIPYHRLEQKISARSSVPTEKTVVSCCTAAREAVVFPRASNRRRIVTARR
jgi:hypothetical protein